MEEKITTSTGIVLLTEQLFGVPAGWVFVALVILAIEIYQLLKGSKKSIVSRLIQFYWYIVDKRAIRRNKK